MASETPEGPGTAGAPSRARATEALQRATGALSTTATSRMQTGMAWFQELSAEDRSWIGLIVQAGITGFVNWYAAGGGPDDLEADGGTRSALAASVFGAAPRALTGVITLRQTVDLIRLSIEVVESNVAAIVAPPDVPDVQRAVSADAREVAFATAEVYARAAETRGAWDARLEALVLDAVLRAEPDDTVLSRASALGWSAEEPVVVVLGSAPTPRGADLFDAVRRQAADAGLDALGAIQGDRLVLILGGAEDGLKAAETVVDVFGPGPVVVGPVAEGLARAHSSARSAQAAYRAATGWPGAPRPVGSIDLLPERALAGDGHARRFLVDEIFLPLHQARGELLETVAAFLEQGAGIEGTARALFVHPNTVRYRLRQAAELTGLTPTAPRDAFTLQVALVLGRQSGRT
ncbi:PucR family transcriptional regulator [Nocardioides sp.]|uniref:PucR family transcriptional regulator n=1 Tax=Nocardioides sp. TaxID=35761 RepID=UPI00352771AC